MEGVIIMKGTYKYMPDEEMTERYPRLSEELRDFYNLLELYTNEKTRSIKFRLESQRNDVFFAIKHLIVAGELSRITAEEIQDYIGGLLDDQF